MKLVIATQNKNKLKEIREKFASISNLEISSLADFENPPQVIEDGTTFEENALKKARQISQFTDQPVMSDDSGLVIDALDGRPGIYSARYAGEDATEEERNRLVLKEMMEIPDSRRSARFVCVVAIVLPDGIEFTVKGECEGIINHEMKGSNGFGYDPIFFLKHERKTMAELSISEKNRISHRAIALEKALKILRDIFSN